MAIAVDSSSPAPVTSGFGSSKTTAVFNPPAGVLVAACGGNGSSSSSTTTFSVNNNGVGLVWTQINIRNKGDASSQPGAAALFYAVLPAARTGMTVTVNSSTVDCGLEVYVLTGADTASPLGAIAEGSSTSRPFTTTGFTSVGAGSLGFVAVSDYAQTAAISSSDTTFTANSGIAHAGGSGYKSIPTAGASITMSITPGSSTTPACNWVSCEIKASTAVAPSPRQIAQRRRRVALLGR